MRTWLRSLSTAGLTLAWLIAPSPAALAQESPPPSEPSPPVQEAPAFPLSLEEVLKSSLEKNLDIAIRRYDPKISETRIETQKALFDPSISGFGVAGEDNSPQTDPLTGAFVGSSRDKTFGATYLDPLQIGSTFQFDLFTNRHVVIQPGAPNFVSYFTQGTATYTQPLLRNLGRRVNRTPIVIAQNNEQISKSQFQQTVMDTLSAAEKAYWDLNFAIMDLKTNQASLKLAQDFLDQTKVKVRVGTLPPIEITQAEAGVADREEGVILAQAAIRTAEDNLKSLMNIPPDSPLWNQPIQPSDEPHVLDKVVVEEEAIRTALEKRPDLEQARLNLASRDADLRYRRNQKLYRLDLVAKYGAVGLEGDPFGTGVTESFEDVARRERTSWSAQMQLGIPLGNRSAEAAYASSRYQEDQSKLTLAQLEQSARVQVRDAVRQIDTNLKRYRAAQVNSRLQREKLAAEQKKYENGMSTTFQILQFQTDLTTAESRENRAIVDYNKSLVELDRVLGILTDTRNVSITD